MNKKSIPNIVTFFGVLSAVLVIISAFVPYEFAIRSLLTAMVLALWSNHWLLEDRL